MFFFADMLWENSDFIGNSYPPEVCGAILRSMEKLSRIKSEGVITGMTPSEFSVLCCAEQFPRKHGGTAASVADIAALMGVSVPAVSRTLRSLQGRGWIERTIDRRSVRVSITPAGREKLLDNMSRVVGSLNRILSVFTEDEMRDVARLYSKFASATAEQLGER
mgnify:CR=1 FL=1